MAAKNKRPIRCLLADDHEVVREGLRSLLEKEPDIEVVGAVGDGRSAIEAARALAPDVVVMDVGMPEVNGIDATRQMRAASINARVLCLSMHQEKGVITAMLQAGACGYLLKTGAAQELVEAVRVAAAGGTYLSPPIVKDIVTHGAAGSDGEEGGGRPKMTAREREVLLLIAEGCHTKEIAARLDISIKTVFTHRERVMRKLGLHSNVELAKYALREGLSEL